MKKQSIVGKFFWKKEWYSICSMHRNYKEECKMCNTGSYVNVWKHNISSLVFKYFPNLWRKIVNFKIKTR